MKSTYSVAEAQSQLPRIVKEAESGRTVAIQRRKETVVFMISRERMEAIAETLEILANPAAMRAIREHRGGKTRFVPLSALDRREG